MEKRNKKRIDEVENELLSLIGEIDYGEIESLDTYWASLANSLLNLEIKGWQKPESFEIPSVSEILTSINLNDVDKDLISICENMESLSEESSKDSVNEENLEELQGCTPDFEQLFEIFLDGLRAKLS